MTINQVLVSLWVSFYGSACMSALSYNEKNRFSKSEKAISAFGLILGRDSAGNHDARGTGLSKAAGQSSAVAAHVKVLDGADL